jgi:heterodisulfide reductase subunit A
VKSVTLFFISFFLISQQLSNFTKTCNNMSNAVKTGVYFCKHLNGHPDSIQLNELYTFAEGMEEISHIWKTGDLDLLDHQKLAGVISAQGINRIVLAGEKPGFIQSMFSKALAVAGMDPAQITNVSFTEYNATQQKDTPLAKAILACAVLDVPFELAAIPDEVDVNPDTLVIGGGIAGIQAALEIANAGKKVYLLERTGTIGGHMAMFDKTFPTLDCAACILTPKMVEIGQHPNIELMTYCEVDGVNGSPGDFQVKVLKKARRVDLATCIGCGICTEKCPAKAPSEFDDGTTLRKSIYIPFPQAVPNKWLIDADSCTYVKNGKCGVCVKFCPVENCINLDEKDETVEINVGNIVVATGFQTFDPKRAEQYNYGTHPNVVTSLEFERLVNAAGPTGGLIKFREQDKKGNWIFTEEGKEPKSVAIIHCIGSRDHNYNKYCSRVCCMYSLKLAHLVKEKIPNADVYEFYIDMRAFGKGYEEFSERIKEEGVHMIRGRTARVEEKDGQLMVRSEEIYEERILETKVDMVVLSVGLEAREDAGGVATMLGIEQGEEGWFVEKNYLTEPTSTSSGGITIAGACQGPKDIPDTVAQASAAAARVLQTILKGKIKLGLKDLPPEKIIENARQISPLKMEVES